MKREQLLNEIGEAMKHFKKKQIESEKGLMYTFALNKLKNKEAGALVLILKGKQKLKSIKTKTHKKSYNDYIGTKNFFAAISNNGFIKMFGKKLKPGEVRYGRLKLSMLKRKKK